MGCFIPPNTYKLAASFLCSLSHSLLFVVNSDKVSEHVHSQIHHKRAQPDLSRSSI
jgi:hypothetical protein